jgi:hypothetical protein
MAKKTVVSKKNKHNGKVLTTKEIAEARPVPMPELSKSEQVIKKDCDSHKNEE